MFSRVHDIKLILIVFGLSYNYDNCFKCGLDNKVAHCLNSIVYGVWELITSVLSGVLCSNHFAISTSISNGFHPKKKENEHS